MPKLGTVSVTGASGERYELGVYPRADVFKPLGAVFFLAKRIPFAEGEAEYTWIYVGETADLSRWPGAGAPTACIDAREANSICLLIEEDQSLRRRIVADIREAHKPPCNPT
jgi:hypothetical protein